MKENGATVPFHLAWIEAGLLLACLTAPGPLAVACLPVVDHTLTLSGARHPVNHAPGAIQL